MTSEELLMSSLENVPEIEANNGGQSSCESERNLVRAMEQNRTVFSEYTWASDDSSLLENLALNGNSNMQILYHKAPTA